MIHIWVDIVYFLYFIVCIMATGAYLCVFFVFFVVVYLLATFVFYGWPALLTFGFSVGMLKTDNLLSGYPFIG